MLLLSINISSEFNFRDVTSGIFHNNAAEQWIEINNETHNAYFMVNGGRLDLFVLLGPSLKEVVRQYIDLTGKPHLPQVFISKFTGLHFQNSKFTRLENVDIIINCFQLMLDTLYFFNFYWLFRKFLNSPF